MNQLGIGSVVYRRVPYLREQWEPRTITGETARSWVCKVGRNEYKVPKNAKQARERGWRLSQHEVALDEWDKDNRWKIVRLLHDRNVPTATLDAIAAILGYEPRAPKEEQ